MSNGITRKKTIFTRPTPRATGSASTDTTTHNARRAFALDELDADELCHFVKRVAEHGDLACFTLTSDGGALSITVIQGDTRHKAYAKDDAEAIERYSDLLEELY